MHTGQTRRPAGRIGSIAAMLLPLLILVQVVRWGGTARGGPLFIAGVALLTSLLAGLGAAIWWFYLSPLPNHRPAASILSQRQQQGLASGVILGGLLFLIGGFWDEVWHRRYGGFGNDFLWAPHMMLYASILLFTAFAGAGIWLTLRRPGRLRERFRSEPLLGLIGLVSAFLLVSLPSDELWHRIYGTDLTAWSLPHLTLMLGLTFIMFAGVATQLALSPADDGWRGLRTSSWPILLVIVLMAWVCSMLLQVGITEWDNVRRPSSADAFVSAFWQRPAWLYPVVVLTIAVWSATITLHATRRFGAASAMVLLVIGLRWFLIQMLGGELPGGSMKLTSHVLTLIPALALDGWYWVNRRRADSRAGVLGGSVAAALAFGLAGLPIISRVMEDPPIDRTTLPGIAAFGLAMAILAGWGGAALGGRLRTIGQAARLETAADRRGLWATLGLVAVVLATTMAIIATTSPPQG